MRSSQAVSQGCSHLKRKLEGAEDLLLRWITHRWLFGRKAEIPCLMGCLECPVSLRASYFLQETIERAVPRTCITSPQR